jgi:uncharacterized tellurite resistance protein B-like protein
VICYYFVTVFSWFSKKQAAPQKARGQKLYDEIRGHLGSDDDELVRIVASVAALLLCVAHADSNYDEAEEQVLRHTLARIDGLDQTGVNAIAKVLRAHEVEITSAEASSYARELLGLCADDFRLQLLDVLVDLAAADDVITVVETNMLRGVSRALGLTQEDYNASQVRHRDKLGVLKN